MDLGPPVPRDTHGYCDLLGMVSVEMINYLRPPKLSPPPTYIICSNRLYKAAPTPPPYTPLHLNNMSSLSQQANSSTVPIGGDLHQAPNKPRTPNFPEDLCQSSQWMQSSGPPPEGPRDVHVLTADLVNNIPYKHWATGWRQGSDPVTLPNGCNTTPCSSIDVLNTLEKGSLGWWQEILAISAEELYYAKQDNGSQAVDDEWERAMGSTGTGTTYQNYQGLSDRPAGPVRQSHPECPKPAPERKPMNRAAMAEIATDIMATWASAERRVMIRDLIAEEPNQPEEMDEGLFVYHTDADKIALRRRFDASYANGFEEGRQIALQRLYPFIPLLIVSHNICLASNLGKQTNSLGLGEERRELLVVILGLRSSWKSRESKS